MAAFRYYFDVQVKRQISAGILLEETREVVFYGLSEKEARAQYFEAYGFEAGELKERKSF